ncbi:zinc-binding dehydrogenase [Subtercola lobariae]|uniref:Dehydrogenase n=1 Tax=Subtercola lobariae TaxID=1588641 RepID=A0A917EVA1_9MICO|nr:zinc-binding dehydrogenase [Subtercola lobariae]GGF21316.1 dehydrogenase [Subtercola lobariae]
MKAVSASGGALEYVDVEVPAPGAGQLLLDVKRCGICGSDLHSLKHGDDLADVLTLCGYTRFMRSGEHVIMGHELYGVVAELGPWTRGTLAVGTPVVTVPLVRHGKKVDGIGLSADAPGAYAEQVTVQESLTLAVPNGLDADTAALTEPMAVAWHAVARSEIRKKEVAVVIGCGPVGLAVIAVLKARGVETIVASDYSPTRRALARRSGATEIVNPATESVWQRLGGHGFNQTMPDEYNAGIDLIESSSKLPVPWWSTWRALDTVGATHPKRPVVFECVGVPGMIDGILADAPLHTRVVVVGVTMGADAIRPSLAINKEIELRFVVGYTPLEFRDTLHALADGKLDASHIVTGRVGLPGVANAFTALGDPETHAKIVIDPSLAGEEVVRL